MNTTGFPVDLPRRAFRRQRMSLVMVADQPGPGELTHRLRRFDMFACLNETELSELAATCRVRTFRAGESIWREGETNRYALFIEQGLAKTSRRNLRGVNRTYGLHGPGDSMGIYAIWAGMTYPTDAVAINDGMTAILIEPDVLVDFAERYPRLASALPVEISRFTEAFIHKIEIVSAGTVPQRLATLMAMLIKRYGIETPDNAAHLPLSLTLEHLSEIVDARIETVARALGRWRRQGWLEIDSEGWHFADLAQLSALSHHDTAS